MRRVACMLIAVLLSGCTSVPRYARSTVIPRMGFRQTPLLTVIEQLNSEIAKQDADLPRIEIDRTPTVVVRPKSLVHFSHHMDALERRYRTTLPTESETPPLCFSADQITLHEACHIIASVLLLELAYRPDAIVFRFGPESAYFRAYPVPVGMVAALKTYPDDGHVGFRCFEPPPPWNGDRMMSIEKGTAILFVGTEKEHEEFRKEMAKR